MSLNSIMNIATSGLFASQSALKTVSQNVSNVNTPGYVRLDHNQRLREMDGRGNGVDVQTATRAADRFLQAAGLAASSSANSAGIRADYLDKVQAAFGDPTSESSIFATLNRTLASLEKAVLNAGSITARRDAVAEFQNFISRLGSLGQTVQDARHDADTRIGTQVDRVNTLLSDIAKTNLDIQRGNAAGDSTGAQQRQSGLMDELSKLIDIRVSQREDGTSEVRTSNGVMLAGYDHAVLSFTPSTAGSATFNHIKIQFGSDPTQHEFEPNLQSGSLRGLIDVRDQDLGKIAYSIGELAGSFGDALNSVHNQNATLPPLSKASGKDTGLLASDALNFTGKTTIGIVDPAGKLVSKIDVDFTAGTISVNGVVTGATGGTIGSFVAGLNAALGANGTATFANGKLEINAAAPVPATATPNGFVFDEPATGGSDRGGRAFAHYFGLNDLITGGGPLTFATGLSATDAHGFTVGAPMQYRIMRKDGAVMVDRTITIPAGTIGDIINSLNNVATGLGAYGGFSLDSKGQMKWTPNPGQDDLKLEVVQDSPPRTGINRSFNQMFGLDPHAREIRATGLAVNSDIVASPSKLGFARPDLTGVALGALAYGAADSRGAQALFDVKKLQMTFAEADSPNIKTMTFGDFATSLGGDVGRMASNAEATRDSSQAFMDEATTRRSNIEGVNLDEELVKLTTYQQSYAAAARMIKAVDEMYQTLLQSV